MQLYIKEILSKNTKLFPRNRAGGPSAYPKGIKITKEEVEELDIIRDEFHGEWNYTFKPIKEGGA